MDLKRGSLTPAFICLITVWYEGQKCIKKKVKYMPLLLRHTDKMILKTVAFNEKTMEKVDEEGK